jgi:hypothetical protein
VKELAKSINRQVACKKLGKESWNEQARASMPVTALFMEFA